MVVYLIALVVLLYVMTISALVLVARSACRLNQMAVYDFDFDIGQRAFCIIRNPMYREACRSCNGTGVGEYSLCYKCNTSGVGMYMFYPEGHVAIWCIGKITSITITNKGVYFSGSERPHLECMESDLYHSRRSAKDFCRHKGWTVVDD